jgi:hypothetical protein
MKSTLELRIEEDDARRYLPPDIGTAIGDGIGPGIRKVELSVDDPLVGDVAAVHERLRASRGHGLFWSWQFHRRYSREELLTADLLRLSIPRVFEPAGEECGTTYDYGKACAICGAGRVQVSPLILDLRRLQPGRDIETRTVPNKDLARTIANEIIVSSRLAELLKDAKISGVDLMPVFQMGQPTASEDWRQLVITGHPVEAVAPTAFGIDPFDLDEEGRYRCPLGHVAGLNLVSELTISAATWGGTDVATTRQQVGTRQGLLVPGPLIVVSPRVWQLLESNKVRGCVVEVAQVAPAST